jgi:hypothetical protein
LKEFAEELRSVIMSIIPSKTPINLVFDGVVEESDENVSTLSGYRLGQVPLEVSDESDHLLDSAVSEFLIQLLLLFFFFFIESARENKNYSSSAAI